MANVTIPYRFVVKRDTAAAFVAANTLLLQGEFGLELDTGRMKMGDGVTPWNSLVAYVVPGLYDLTGLADGDSLVWDAAAERFVPGAGAGIVSIVPGAGIAVDDTDPANPIVSATAGSRGITITGGSIGGSVIDAGQQIGGLSASDYTLTGNWYLWCSPSGSIELDVRRATFATLPPEGSDSICGGNEPAVVANTSASGDFTGWTTSIDRGDALSVVVNSVTGVTFFVLLLEAT